MHLCGSASGKNGSCHKFSYFSYFVVLSVIRLIRGQEYTILLSIIKLAKLCLPGTIDYLELLMPGGGGGGGVGQAPTPPN